MKYISTFSLFEAEIFNGARFHYNGLKPVNQQIFEPEKLYSYECDNCHFEFMVDNPNQENCNICQSEMIKKLAQ